MDEKAALLVLCRRVIADLILAEISKTDIRASAVLDSNDAIAAAMFHKPSIALVEIPEGKIGAAEETLGVCAGMREISPGCKIVLLCPEYDKASVKSCVEAKRQGKIEDFFFFSVSTDYLVSILMALHGAKEV